MNCGGSDQSLRSSAARWACELAPEQIGLAATWPWCSSAWSGHRESEAILRELVRLAPTDSDLWCNLGELRKARGHLPEALEAFRRATALPNAHRAAFDNVLLLLHYLPDMGREEMAAEHRHYGERFDRPPPEDSAGCHGNDPDPERPLLIGYLSPDVHRHAAARFIEPLLLARDRRRYTVVLYGEVAQPDAVSERLIAAADGWRCTWRRGAEEVARMVRDDRIGLLVDLAGHTASNRLDGMALRLVSPHQIFRLNGPLLELWGRVLQALPEARLVFLRHSFTAGNRQAMTQRLIAHGMDPDRAEFQRPVLHDRAYMELLGRFDLLMLDTFP